MIGNHPSPHDYLAIYSTQCGPILYCIIYCACSFLGITQQHIMGSLSYMHHAVFDVSAPRGRLVGFIDHTFTPQVPYWTHVVYLNEYYILSFAIGFRTAVCAIELDWSKNAYLGWLEDFLKVRTCPFWRALSVSWLSMFRAGRQCIKFISCT
jgi:hypothetical protein